MKPDRPKPRPPKPDEGHVAEVVHTPRPKDPFSYRRSAGAGPLPRSPRPPRLHDRGRS
jgi:hypothetical protein